MGLPSLSDCVALVDRFAPLMLDTAMRSVVVLGLAAIAAVAMRRASAAARHWVWLMGFAGLLMLPAMSLMLPGWRVLPRVEMNRSISVATDTIATPVAAPTLEQRPRTFRSELTAAAKQEAVSSLPAETPATPVASPSQAAAPAAQPIAPAGNPQRIVLSWPFWLVAVWLAGALLVLSPMLLGYLSLSFLQRRCTRISQGEWSALLAQVRRELGIHREVELLSTPLRTMPMTWGLWQARLLLPEDAENWPAAQRRSVLLHELGHVRRRDCLTQFLAQIACALYWFNPLAWVASRRMQVERERACDDLVLNSGAKASLYAEHLLQSAAAMPVMRFVGAAALAMARASTFEERMRAILDGRRNRTAISAQSAVGTFLLLLAAVIPVAALKAQETPANTPPVVVPSTRPANSNDANLSIEERMRIRRQTDAATPSAANPASTTAPTATARGGAGARGARGPGGLPQAERTRQAALGEGPTCVLDAMVYDIRLPANKIGRLDPDALTKIAGNAEAFETALAELGTVRPLYRVHQSVRLAGDSITIGSNVPYVTGSVTNGQTGRVTNAVNYVAVGAMFDLTGRPTPTGSIELDMRVQVSSMSDSRTAISDDVHASTFRNGSMSHKGIVEPQKPFVIMSVDASAIDSEGQAAAYITRVTLGQLQSSSVAPPASQQPASASLIWRGLNLSNARVTTLASELPDIWEEQPPGSKSYEVRADVEVIRPPDIRTPGTIYWNKSKNRFYVQHDPLASSTHHFYGPFDGNPNQVLSQPAAQPTGS